MVHYKITLRAQIKHNYNKQLSRSEKMKTTLKKGQKIRTRYGDIRTVRSVNDCQVFVEEENNRWYHPTKVFAIR